MTRIKVIAGKNDLATTHPELLEEWDYDKNEVLPTEITYAMNIKIQWKCKYGHTWETYLSNRTRQHTGCPYCANKKVLAGFNDLATTHPELLSEWDYEKNTILPTEITAGTSKKIWWKCSRGHRWQASVRDRTGKRRRGCPICSKSFQTSFPEQAVLFYCKKCDETVQGNVRMGGFQWDISIPNKRILIEYDGWLYHHIPTERSNLRTQWASTNNYTVYHIIEVKESNIYEIRGTNIYFTQCNISLLDKSIHDLIKMIFGIDIDVNVNKDNILILQQYNPQYRHNIVIDNTTQILGNDEFLSHSLGIMRPDIASEWHVTKNGDITPYDVSEHSNFYAWWQCPNNENHVYQTKVSNRTSKNGTNCPYCAGQLTCIGEDFASLYPQLVEYWDVEKNEIKPSDVLPHSQRKIHWKCPHCGHSWVARVSQITMSKTHCPNCKKLEKEQKRIEKEKSKLPKRYLGIEYPNLIKEWDFAKNNCDPYKITCGTNTKYWWKCDKGHSWQATIKARISGRGCPYCNGKYINIGVNDLQSCNQRLAKEFDVEKNGTTPDKVFAKSRKKYWWKCSYCGYEWMSTPNSRQHTDNNRCPSCRQ